MPRRYDQDCPVARTLDIIGDRWTVLVVRDLFLGKTRYQQLLASSPGIPPKLLSDRLKKLEQHGLVQRTVYSQHPLRAEYTLTEKGRSLEPVMMAIVRWGLEHCFDEADAGLRASIERYILERVRPTPA